MPPRAWAGGHGHHAPPWGGAGPRRRCPSWRSPRPPLSGGGGGPRAGPPRARGAAGGAAAAGGAGWSSRLSIGLGRLAGVGLARERRGNENFDVVHGADRTGTTNPHGGAQRLGQVLRAVVGLRGP